MHGLLPVERFCKTKMCTNFRSTSRSEKLRTNFCNFGRETCREREMNFRRKFREIGSCRTCTVGACKLRKSAEHKVRAKIRTHFRKACCETSFEFSLCRTSQVPGVHGLLAVPRVYQHLHALVLPVRNTPLCQYVWWRPLTSCWWIATWTSVVPVLVHYQ